MWNFQSTKIFHCETTFRILQDLKREHLWSKMFEIFGAQKRCAMNGFFEFYKIWKESIYGLKCVKFSEHKNGCDWALPWLFGATMLEIIIRYEGSLFLWAQKKSGVFAVFASFCDVCVIKNGGFWPFCKIFLKCWK